MSDRVAYVASVSDCTNLVYVDISAGSVQKNLSVSDASRVSGSAMGSAFSLTAEAEGRFSPQITLHHRDNTSDIHTESFSIEANAPTLALDSVSLQNIDGVQSLIVQADVADDVDIQYIGFSVVGIRASDLRAAGGVITRVKDNAFVQTEGVVRVYPERNDQEIYSVAVGTNQL
jgi:hypothetical protein